VKIAIIGSGAMGSIYGGAFHDAGNEVLFVDVNRELVDAVNERGMIIERKDGPHTYRIPATTTPADHPACDLLMFQVKGFQTRAAAAFARPLVQKGTLVLSLQNGLGNCEALAETYPDSEILAGNNVGSVTVIGPGHVSHTGVGPTYIGPFRGSDQTSAQRVADALEPSGFEVHVLANVKQQIWRKLLINCALLGAAALTGLDADGLAKRGPVLDLANDVLRETIAIAEADGCSFDVDEEIAGMYQIVSHAGGKSSMLQDVEAGRRTEIDSISGAAMRVASQYGISCPLNTTIWSLVKGREQAMGIES
jgi:2-dehydropantoate 2-reductase